MSKKNILFIITEDWYFLSHRLPIAMEAIKNDYEVTLLCNVNDKRKIIESYGINLVDWNINRGSKNIFGDFYSIYIIYKTIKKIQPDLIFSVAAKPVLYTSFISKLLDIKCNVYAFAGMGNLFNSKDLFSNIFRKIYITLIRFNFKKSKKKLILQNNDDKNFILGLNIINKEDIKVVRGSGVDTKKFNFTKIGKSSKPIVLLPARMLWDKGVQDFVDCSKKIKETMSARFVLVGDPDPYNPQSIPKENLNKWNDDRIVEWWGHRDDMNEVFDQSQIVCFPSYIEGLPKALLEAASKGRPIVAYDVPGCREVVENNKNGILVPFQRKDLLIESITKLLLDDELCEKYGNNGRKIIEKNFTQEIVSKKILEIFNEELTL